MTKPSEIQLTAANIKVLAALIYEPVPRVWMNGRWCCPHCLQLNSKKKRECGCGISRDAAPQRSIEADELREPLQMGALLVPETLACVLLADHRQPPPSAL